MNETHRRADAMTRGDGRCIANDMEDERAGASCSQDVAKISFNFKLGQKAPFIPFFRTHHSPGPNCKVLILVGRTIWTLKEKRFFGPDNNHTTQGYTGGVWFFIVATPKHQMFQGKKELGPCRWENYELRKTVQARWWTAQENFPCCVGRWKFFSIDVWYAK